MAAWNFQSKKLLQSDSLASETLTVPAGETKYSPEFQANHLDSIHGIWLHLQGVITGAGAVTIQLETAIRGGAAGVWQSAGDPVVYTGTSKSFLVVPTTAAPIAPNCRIKITVAAVTSVIFSEILHTSRGLN